MKITGAQAILQSLIQEGVELIFGYPGGAIMPLYDALYDVQSLLRHVLVRHEQGALHAAEGYARVSRKVAVCVVTSGPGATNVVTGIADAMMDSVPLVCITGQVSSAFLGTDAFQEADIVGITLSMTKWNYQITRAEEIPGIVAKAFFLAKEGRPGPVLLDITKDAQLGYVDYSYHKILLPLCKEATVAELQCAANLLHQAQKPLLLVGQGVTLSGAENALLAFAEKTNIPVACTLLGLSAFPASHPLYVGMLGMHGNYAPNLLTNEADVLIAVGMRFDDRVTGNLDFYAKKAKVIHIEIDAYEVNKNVQADVVILADAKAALAQLISLVSYKAYTEWWGAFHSCYQKEYQAVIQKEIQSLEPTIKMAEVVYQLSQKTEGKAVLVTDVGQHQMIAARYYAFQQPRSHVTSGGLGTMGFALPASIGVSLASQGCMVIAIIGDGGFQMNIQELAVIAEQNIPVKIVLLNNSYLGMVRQWQELFFEARYSFTELKNPDFMKIAEGYGISCHRVEKKEQLAEAIVDMLKARGPYLLEVVVEKQSNVFPMVPHGEAVDAVRLS